MKTHLQVYGPDCRDQGQTEKEYRHQAACGYVRDAVTRQPELVDCFYCKRTTEFKEMEACNS